MEGQLQGRNKCFPRMRGVYHGLLCWFLCGVPVMVTYAQTDISGNLVDTAGMPIGNATLTYRVPGQTTVLGFTRSETNGLFHFSVRLADVDSLQLDIRHLGYQPKQIMLPNRNEQYRFVLQAADNILETVNVGSPPIFLRKDTLNYHVDAFKAAEDRVIADVIRRLPGIEVQDGQILYQGRPIQRYMVNNLDLMGGRYGMINHNLPADAVRNVQVIANDQPIRILDSLVFSDQVSLNLEIRKYTTTGSGRLGGGGPTRWDAGITPITLARNFQMLTSLQTNNIGHDAAGDLQSFYSDGVVDARHLIPEAEPSFVSLKNLNTPPLQEKKWRDNQVFLGSANILKKLDDGLQLRGNLAYQWDRLRREGRLITEFFDQEQTFLTTEQIDNRYGIQVLEAGLNLEKNVSSIYFKNNLAFQTKRNRDQGHLTFNHIDPILQHRNYDQYSLANSLTAMRYVGKQMVHFNSSLDWLRTPQRLRIWPGQLEDLLHQGMPYDQLDQQVDSRTFTLINSAYFIRRMGNWRIRPSVGLHYQSNHIQSQLNLHDQGQVEILGEAYRNDVRNTWLKGVAGTNLSYEKGRWTLDLGLPYTFHVMGKEVRHAINPNLRASYHLSRRHDFTFNVSSGPSFTGIDRAYGAYILQSYRSIQRSDRRVLTSYAHTMRMGYQYKNESQGTFANLSYTLNQAHQLYTYGTTLDDLGRISVSIHDRPTERLSHSVNGGLSRYISPIKTLFRLNLSAGISQQDYLLNEQANSRQSMRLGGNLEASNNLSSFLSGRYRFDYQYMHSLLSAGHTNRLLATGHFLDLNFFLFRKHTLIIEQALNNHHIPGQEAPYFMDITYRYRIIKWKLDLDASAINLWDNHRYIQEISSDYQFIQSSYELRPRQFMLTVKFQF